jgi:hypothetical protein
MAVTRRAKSRWRSNGGKVKNSKLQLRTQD